MTFQPCRPATIKLLPYEGAPFGARFFVAWGWPRGGGVGTPYRWDHRRLAPAAWSPAPIRGGDPGFLYEKARTQRVAGGSPCTPVNKTARWGSLHLLGWWPLERSLSGSCAPDQIWIRIFGKYFLAGYCSVEKSSLKKSQKRKSPNQGT